jgi:hypothetical protein
LPVRVGLFHEADLPFRIHCCGFENCVTPRRRGGAFQQRSVLIQIRTPPLNFRSAPTPSPVVRGTKRNQQRNQICEVSQPLTQCCDPRLRCSGQHDRNARARWRVQRGCVHVCARKRAPKVTTALPPMRDRRDFSNPGGFNFLKPTTL